MKNEFFKQFSVFVLLLIPVQVKIYLGWHIHTKIVFPTFSLLHFFYHLLFYYRLSIQKLRLISIQH